MASSTGVDLSVSGLASGFDWKSLVTQLAQAERAPKTVWQANQSKLNQQNSIYGSIKSYLRNVQAYAQKLKDPALYEARSALSSSASVASASASPGGLTGTFSFNISYLATAAVLNGTSGISNILVPGGDPNSVTVGAAGFSAPVTAGTFTVNGKQINIATTDSLQQVFASIASATGNTVTASYDSGTDKIILKSATTGQEIVLGSATDTSNFLQVAQLYNTGSDTVSSLSAVGRANTSATLAHANLQTGITDGGSGNGAFFGQRRHGQLQRRQRHAAKCAGPHQQFDRQRERAIRCGEQPVCADEQIHRRHGRGAAGCHGKFSGGHRPRGRRAGAWTKPGLCHQQRPDAGQPVQHDWQQQFRHRGLVRHGFDGRHHDRDRGQRHVGGADRRAGFCQRLQQRPVLHHHTVGQFHRLDRHGGGRPADRRFKRGGSRDDPAHQYFFTGINPRYFGHLQHAGQPGDHVQWPR